MAVSKVVLGDETLIDLTGDSVSSENLLQGETAHGANGEEVIGGVVVTPMYTGTKAAIEEAIALGQIPEDSVVNITDDEEASSFQTQINEINSSLLKFMEAMGYDPDIIALIPVMTSDTTPSGQVIYQSSHSDEFAPWKCFDGNTSTAGTTKGGNGSYIGYKFENPVCVKKAYIKMNNGSNFTIQASNDNFVTKKDFVTLSCDGQSEQTINIDNDEKYTYYRLYCNSMLSGAYFSLREIQFYGRE